MLSNLYSIIFVMITKTLETHINSHFMKISRQKEGFFIFVIYFIFLTVR